MLTSTAQLRSSRNKNVRQNEIGLKNTLYQLLKNCIDRKEINKFALSLWIQETQWL